MHGSRKEHVYYLPAVKAQKVVECICSDSCLQNAFPAATPEI